MEDQSGSGSEQFSLQKYDQNCMPALPLVVNIKFINQ
jgi:hypothetical protein